MLGAVLSVGSALIVERQRVRNQNEREANTRAIEARRAGRMVAAELRFIGLMLEDAIKQHHWPPVDGWRPQMPQWQAHGAALAMGDTDCVALQEAYAYLHIIAADPPAESGAVSDGMLNVVREALARIGAALRELEPLTSAPTGAHSGAHTPDRP